METNENIKYVLYARKSTESDEKQALSIDSQLNEMNQIAERLKLNIVCIKKESHSAKASGSRPVFQEILKDIRNEKYNGILTWAPDRLSRNAGDLGSLVDLMDQKKLVRIQTHGQVFSNSPNEKFLLMILCSQAKLENDNRSINVKRGMRARCEMGLWPGKAPTGYMKPDSRDRKCEVDIDPERAPMVKQVFEKLAYEKMSVRGICSWLRYEINFKTLNGNYLSAGNLFKILNNTFYYGAFEFPRGSGKWYQGIHKPIITKELFDLARSSIKSQIIKSYGKEFAFTRIIKCGDCGSSIVADEKFKKLKSGGVNRHVYYRCCKSKDMNCKNPAINETDLIKMLQGMLSKLNLNEVQLTEKLNLEIQRFKKMQAMFLGKEKTKDIRPVDLQEYAIFVLKEGSILEKRSILECLKSEIIMKNKLVLLRS